MPFRSAASSLARFAGVALVAAGLIFASPTRAELVSFVADGTIFDLVDVHGILDGSVSLGGPMRALVIYDTDVADLSSGDPVAGTYPQAVPPALLRVEMGSYAIEVPTTYVLEVVDGGLFGDNLLFRRENSRFPFPSEPGVTIDFVSLGFLDGSGLVFSSDAIPTLPPTLTDFEAAQLDVTGCLDGESGTIVCPAPNTLAVRATITTVPEPSGGALTAIVLLLGAARAAAGTTPSDPVAAPTSV